MASRSERGITPLRLALQKQNNLLPAPDGGTGRRAYLFDQQ
jgi:hypothetical protein